MIAGQVAGHGPVCINVLVNDRRMPCFRGTEPPQVNTSSIGQQYLVALKSLTQGCGSEIYSVL